MQPGNKEEDATNIFPIKFQSLNRATMHLLRNHRLFTYNRKAMKKQPPHSTSFFWHQRIAAVAIFSFVIMVSGTLSAAATETPIGAKTLNQVKNITVKGTVKDEKGETLPGVSVSIAGTKLGTVTNNDGVYELNAPEDGTLVFSYIGFLSQNVSIDARKSINVTLKLSQLGKDLNEVVVVGYGTQKRSDITGSVTSVPKERLSSLPVTNVLQAIEGTTAGLTLPRALRFREARQVCSSGVLIRSMRVPRRWLW